jgi:hypothetical protein
MPSFAFYHLMGHVSSLHKEFWPYLQETQAHTVDLRHNYIRIQRAEEFERHL